MANTISMCWGEDKNRTKKASRLGNLASEAQANTWQTFTTCYVRKDGSGFIQVVRKGKGVLQRFDFGPE